MDLDINNFIIKFASCHVPAEVKDKDVLLDII